MRASARSDLIRSRTVRTSLKFDDPAAAAHKLERRPQNQYECNYREIRHKNGHVHLEAGAADRMHVAGCGHQLREFLNRIGKKRVHAERFEKHRTAKSVFPVVQNQVKRAEK